MSQQQAASYETASKLTKFRAGGLRELWSLSLPLAISLFSASFMLFADRLLLARFSTDALNASVNATVYFWVLQLGTLSVACIAEVFVGQYNGAGKPKQIGAPVWQMIWFSLLSVLIFLPMGLWGSHWLFGGSRYEALTIEYFGILSFFGPTFPLVGALAAFYIGRGRVGLVVMTTILANVTNILLDVVLIFGVDGLIEPMGVRGAAIATGVGQTLQAVVLLFCVLTKHNRETYNTGKISFRWPIFAQCMRIGTPNALSLTVEILAWAVLMQMITAVSEEMITVASITQSLLLLFLFISEAIGKAVTAIAANAIGAAQWNVVWRVLGSAVKLNIILSLFLVIPFVIYPEPLVDLFLPKHDVTPEFLESVKTVATRACIWVWIYCLVDGIKWAFFGLLTASGDTRFLMITGGTLIWLFAIAPIAVAVLFLGYHYDVAWAISVVAASLIAIVFYWRFRQEKWKASLVAQNEAIDELTS